MRIGIMALVLMAASFAWGQEMPGEPPGQASATAVDSVTHPTLSEDGGWAGAAVLIILLAFFGAAAVIGPIIRANMSTEASPVPSHDKAGTNRHGGRHGASAGPGSGQPAAPHP